MERPQTSTTGYPPTTLTPRWWETVPAMIRPSLKFGNQTLGGLTGRLDSLKERGILAIEVFAPMKGGICYHGLDALDYYTIDPAIGTMDDFLHLVREAHARGMAVIIFTNLGYGHEEFPAFLKACDDVRAGIDSPEVRMFSWSDTGKDVMDRSLAPHFMNDLHGNWRWSERAQKFFWVKWEGEKGGYHLPQFNFGDPGWHAETRRIIDFWLRTGIDGMVIDAVNWYINCNWEITRYSMTDLINQADNQFSQPEGAGGFDDDPVPWIEQGGFNCIMDYAIKKWWTKHDLIRDAVLSGDPRPIEAALRGYRDRVVEAGGVCYIDPPNLGDLPLDAQLLGTAVVATMGELLLILRNEQTAATSPEYQQGLTRLLDARRRFPALCAGGQREVVPTQDDSQFYAYRRKSVDGSPDMLVAFNFQPGPQTLELQLDGGVDQITDFWSGEASPVPGRSIQLKLPGYGFKIFPLE